MSNENLRLRELWALANANRPYFDELLERLKRLGYPSLASFIRDPDEERAETALRTILSAKFASPLYDGIGRPYLARLANWYFLAWVLRDAPAQRLTPMLRAIPGATLISRQARLLNELRTSLAAITDDDAWTWPAVREVVVDRLEGSRRSVKGTLFEEIVRRVIRRYLEGRELALTVQDREVRMFGETYDVVVTGPSGSLLIPVKTRETMGGGHALIFTRDIAKSTRVASENGFRCAPIVIAESWTGDLEGLGTEQFIYLQVNPNQVGLVEPMLDEAIPALDPLFREIAESADPE